MAVSKAHSSHSGPVYFLLRFPLLLAILAILGLELFFYTVCRCFVVAWEFALRGHRAAHARLAAARTYDEWLAAATDLDRLEGKAGVSAGGYDRDLVERLRDELQAGVWETARQPASSRDASRLRRALLNVCVPNLAGLDDERHYAMNHAGVNRDIEEYLKQVIGALRRMRDTPLLKPEAKRRLFRRLMHNYGRTALCLSGGASNGYYHLGVIRALARQGLVPRIISGSSAGSLIGSLLCSRTDEELLAALEPDWTKRLFTPCEEPIWVKITRFLRTGVVFDAEIWRAKMNAITHDADLTFLESYRRTGRVMNISVFDGSRTSKLLSYQNAPNVVMSSAVLCSSAVPKLLPKGELFQKEPSGEVHPYHAMGQFWADGSFKDDIPLDELHKRFRVNYSVVSQVEPHVIPFYFQHRGSAGSPSSHRGGHGWRGGFLSAYLEHFWKLDMKKWLTILRDFDLLPRVFGVDWGFLFLQKIKGCVTIVPKFNIWDCVNLISDPGDRMHHYTLEGERVTWKKIGMLRNRNMIERELANCLKHLAAESDDEGGMMTAESGEDESTDEASFFVFDDNVDDDDDEYQ